MDLVGGIFAMLAMCFLSKQSFILCWWREKKENKEK